ncbi:hypothetical protein [Streptomyces sp. NRRL S-575]|nr:hypothetical protein [Streptomyces sp. NRRL S-575]
MDLSDEGAPFDADATGLPVVDVAGRFPGRRSAADLAAFLVRAGWSSRSSSWEGYDVQSPLARLEIEPVGDGVLLHGQADAGRLDALVAVLSARGLPFAVEFHGEDGAVLREVRVGPADPVSPPVRPRQGPRQRLTDLFTRKG